jgi:hypothetical protein
VRAHLTVLAASVIAACGEPEPEAVLVTGERWTVALGDPTDMSDDATSVAIDAQGDVVVGSWRSIVKLDGRDGSVLWTAQPTGNWVAIYETAVAGDGSVLGVGAFAQWIDLGGGHALEAESDLFVARYDADGQPLWITPLGYDGYAEPFGFAVANDGSSYVTGAFNSFSQADAYIVALDPSGAVSWTREMSNDSTQLGEEVVVLANGDIAMAGSADGSAFVSDWTPAGTQSWLHAIDDMGSVGRKAALAALEDGRVVATAGGYLLAFDRDGDELWRVTSGDHIATHDGAIWSAASQPRLTLYDSDGLRVGYDQIDGHWPDGVVDLAVDSETIAVAGAPGIQVSVFDLQ